MNSARLLACSMTWLILSWLITLTVQLRAAQPDDYWAEALLRGAYDETLNMEQVERLFNEAIESADDKAPVYVALGDYYSAGRASRINQLSAVEEGMSELIPQFPTSDKTPVTSTDSATSTWDELFESNKDLLQDLADTISLPQKQALRCYVSATAANPDYPVGWFRILTNSQATEDQKEKAYQNLKRVDPQNALPHYARAVTFLRMGDLDSALRFAEEGNQAEVRVYSRPRPKNFTLVFPDIGVFRESGIVGKPVPPSLVQMAADSDYSIELSGWRIGMMRLAQLLDQEASRVAADGDWNTAVRLLQAIANMGLKIMRSDPPDVILGMTGSAVALVGVKGLRSLYASAGQDDRILALDQFELARNRFVGEIGTFVISQPDLEEVHEDLVHLAEFEQRQLSKKKAFVQELLASTGLDTYSFAK